MESPDRSPAGGGASSSARSAVRAGAIAGLLLGLLDGLVAASRSAGGPHVAAAVAAAVLVYGLLWCGLLLVAAGLLHAWLQRKSEPRRMAALLGLALGTWLAAEIHWWSRPWVFYGYPFLSAERLLAAVAQVAAGFTLGFWIAGRVARLPSGVLSALPRSAWAASIVGALFLALDGHHTTDRGARNERNRDLPNLLLVVVDALRADHLGCYGSVVETPNLDRLAQRGVLFEQCSVQAPITLASFGSILTGKYPRRHGLVSQVAGARLADDNVTLFRHLKSALRKDGARMAEEDWVVGAFLTGALSQDSGLMGGIDVYSEAMLGRDVVDLGRRWSTFRAELLLWIVKEKLSQQFDSAAVVGHARQWMRELSDRRFAALVHLYSTHTPYDPPAEWRARYLDPAYAGSIDVFHARHRQAFERGDRVPSEADREQIRGLYAGCVSEADAMIGALLDELEALGIEEETLVVVTADHGESLGEQDLWEHDHMLQTNLMVPLIMALPGRLPAGRRVDALVSSIDVLPTISDLFDLVLPAPSGERGGVDGVSLVPVIEGREVAVRPFTFAENAAFLAVQDGAYKLILPRGFRPETVFAPSTAARLHDLSADPAELKNLAMEGTPGRERLFSALAGWDAAMPEAFFLVERTSRHLDQAELLRKLGYGEGSVGER